MNLSLISLILSAIMGVFLLLSVLYGLIVGLKRGLGSAIYNLILVVVLLLTCSLITNFVINFNLSTFGFNINGATTLNDYILNTIKSQEQVASLIESNPEILDMIIKLPLMIASPIVFTVLFWLIKIIVFVISFIVRLIGLAFHRPKRDANGNKIKTKKHHLAGAAIGLVIGVIAIFATFVPIYGIGDIANKLNNYSVDSEGNVSESNSLTLYADENEETTPLLDYLIKNDKVSQILNLYNNSVGVKITKTIGLEKLGTMTFNTLTKTNINGVNVKLTDEVNNVVKVYTDISSINSLINKESLTQAEMTTLLNKAEAMLNSAFESNLVQAIGNTIVPIVLDKIQNDPNFAIKLPESLTDDAIKSAITNAVLNELKNYNMDAIKTNLIKVVNLLQITNNNNILTPAYNKMKAGENLDFTSVLTLLKNSNENFSTQISAGIASINLISNLAPDLIDNGLKAVFEMLDMTYTSNNITKANALLVLNKLLTNTIDGAKTIDLDSDFYVTKNSFSYIGKLLDITKDTNVLNAEQYSDLLDVAQDKLETLSEDFPVRINKIIQNLDNVTSWSNEMNKIGECFDDAEFIYNNIFKDVSIENINLPQIGTLFDKLEATTVFNGAVSPIYNDALDSIKQNITGYGDVVTELKINENATIEWKNELTALKPFFDDIEQLSKFEFKDAESLHDIINLCGTFDTIEQDETSTIYSTKMQPLLTKIFEVTRTNNITNTNIVKVCTKIEYELNNRETNQTLKNCVVEGVFNFASDLIPEASSFSDDNIKAMIAEIKVNINKIIAKTVTADLEKELNYMLDFADFTTDLQNISTIGDEKIKEISDFLDTLSGSVIFNNSKTYILNAVIDIAANAVASGDDDLNIEGVIRGLKNNINVSISTLLDDLESLQDYATDFDGLDINSMDTQNIGDTLNTIRGKETFSDSFTNSIMNNLLDKVNADAQADTLLPATKKLEIATYVNSNKLSDSDTITNTTYKDILDGLKALFE